MTSVIFLLLGGLQFCLKGIVKTSSYDVSVTVLDIPVMLCNFPVVNRLRTFHVATRYLWISLFLVGRLSVFLPHLRAARDYWSITVALSRHNGILGKELPHCFPVDFSGFRAATPKAGVQTLQVITPNLRNRRYRQICSRPSGVQTLLDRFE